MHDKLPTTGMIPKIIRVFQMSQVLKERRRTLSHDSQGMDGDDESVTEFTRTELMAFKPSFARPRYANTYRMEPYRKFQDYVVRKKAEEVLKNKLQDFKYIGFNGAFMCTTLSEDILAAVKDQGFDRYKYIVQIFIVEKTGQSVHIASRWVWDVARDNWVSVQHETENYVALALIVAGYYE
ncbi:dynein light chain Tctex-type protein 2 isoform X2 [Hemicordylus capensis]|uniref:dynein light chain Tctex-type protein 2 isoform X2 n=2 Tax=Hemicordylus capensis TaxID=884348 RepID=UPI002304CD80|nr:dynein light chain Tctex-type protein 2 isoform X2 [Hemicordylus capensis]